MEYNGELLGGTLFIAIGLACFYGVHYLLAKQKIAQSWPTTMGVVLASYLKDEPGSDGGTLYSPYVKYSYTAQGRSCVCDKYQLVDSSSTFKAAEAKKLLAFPVGARVLVHYNPAKPQEAVLQVQTSKVLLGILLAFGVAMVWGGVVLAF